MVSGQKGWHIWCKFQYQFSGRLRGGGWGCCIKENQAAPVLKQERRIKIIY